MIRTKIGYFLVLEEEMSVLTTSNTWIVKRSILLAFSVWLGLLSPAILFIPSARSQPATTTLCKFSSGPAQGQIVNFGGDSYPDWSAMQR